MSCPCQGNAVNSTCGKQWMRSNEWDNFCVETNKTALTPSLASSILSCGRRRRMGLLTFHFTKQLSIGSRILFPKSTLKTMYPNSNLGTPHVNTFVLTTILLTRLWASMKSFSCKTFKFDPGLNRKIMWTHGGGCVVEFGIFWFLFSGLWLVLGLSGILWKLAVNLERSWDCVGL